MVRISKIKAIADAMSGEAHFFINSHLLPVTPLGGRGKGVFSGFFYKRRALILFVRALKSLVSSEVKKACIDWQCIDATNQAKVPTSHVISFSSTKLRQSQVWLQGPGFFNIIHSMALGFVTRQSQRSTSLLSPKQ